MEAVQLNSKENEGSNQESKEIDIEPIKSVVKNKTSRKLSKGFNKTSKKPSWWIRSRRRKLIAGIKNELAKYNIKEAWVHNHFLTAEDRKAKHVTIYMYASNLTEDMNIHLLESLMDKKFKRNKISLIDTQTLQPAIKEFVFKDLISLF